MIVLNAPTIANKIQNILNIGYKFDSKDNKIMEDKTSPNASFEMIFDKNEPFYRHTHTEE